MRTAITYGLLIGVAFVTLSLGMFFLGLDDSPFWRNLNSLSIIFVALGIYFGIKERAELFPDEEISYGVAFRMGLSVAVIAGIVAGFFSYFYFFRIHPQLAEQIIQQKTEMLRNLSIPEEKILRKVNWMRKEYSPKGQFVFNLAAYLLLGAIFSSIFSFFLSDKKSV